MEWSIPPIMSATKPNTNTIKYLDNLTHYTKILHGNKYNQRKINQNNLLLLKKREFDIFYSTRYKYPLLVAETITSRTGLTEPNHPFIDRRQIEDPFRQDIEIPENLQHTLNDYKAYMEYGGSMGHNAPAGQHKTNMDVYNETFLLTNITPQEMVFNSGLWVLMEQWCRNLGRNTHLEKIMVFTGSIPTMFDNDFAGVVMNVPSKMFKIICIKMPEHPDITYIEIFICHNKPYTLDYAVPKYDLSPFLVPHKQLSHFQHESGIDLKKLLEYYGFASSNIQPFRSKLNISINLNPVVRLQLKKSKWFGKLIYAKNLDILERDWSICQTLSKEFENLKFHQEYYELAKRRLKRGSYISRTIPTNYTWISIYNQGIRNTTRKINTGKNKIDKHTTYKNKHQQHQKHQKITKSKLRTRTRTGTRTGTK